MLGQLRDITAKYSPIEGLVYDRLIAPAVADLFHVAGGALVASLPNGAEVLEVGSGGGHLACSVLKARPDLRWTGVDLSPSQVKRAQKRGRAAGCPAHFEQGDALELARPNASCDGVVSVASIKHWPAPARGLAECVRVLRPGGTLVVVEADRGCTYSDAARFVSGWRIPAVMRPAALAFFRTWVAGRSLDLEDMRSLAAELPIARWEVQRIPQTPGLILTGTR